jgi:hypothetical protein
MEKFAKSLLANAPFIARQFDDKNPALILYT